MLASVIGLYVVSAAHGNPSYLLSDLQSIDIDPDTERWLFVGFFVAFAIKAPMFPVHTWLPDTTEQATTGTASCWSASSTRSAPSACCASASGCSPTRRSGRRRS